MADCQQLMRLAASGRCKRKMVLRLKLGFKYLKFYGGANVIAHVRLRYLQQKISEGCGAERGLGSKIGPSSVAEVIHIVVRIKGTP